MVQLLLDAGHHLLELRPCQVGFRASDRTDHDCCWQVIWPRLFEPW